MRTPFHGRTTLLEESFSVAEIGNAVCIVLKHSDTNRQTIVDLDKRTAIELAHWILKEVECDSK